MYVWVCMGMFHCVPAKRKTVFLHLNVTVCLKYVLGTINLTTQIFKPNCTASSILDSEDRGQKCITVGTKAVSTNVQTL